MRVVCAWCECVIEEGPERELSHGICDECAEEVFPKDEDQTHEGPGAEAPSPR